MHQQETTSQNKNVEAGFSALMVVATGNRPADLGGREECVQLAGEWFALDVANGDARPDTIRTYLSQLGQWLTWCRDNGHDPGRPTVEAVKGYRRELVASGLAHATIGLKLTTVRRFYDGAAARGLLDHNPAANIKAPRDRSAQDETVKCLSAGEAELVFRAIPRDGRLKSLRDRAMTCLMLLEGLRRTEVCRANLKDLEETATGHRMLVRGKGRDGYVYPREDSLACLKAYLAARSNPLSDQDGEPMFVSLSKDGRELGRISRIGLSKWMDKLLLAAGVEKKGRACHALRHTCGSLLYQATRDVKVVQEVLRHASIAQAAKYSHVEERAKARYTKAIPVRP